MIQLSQMNIAEKESLAYLFVPQNIAKLAIKHGFNEKTFFVWDSENYLQEETIMKELNLPFVIAPMYDQLLNWLRTKYSICLSQNLANKSYYTFQYSYLDNDRVSIGASDDNYYKALNFALIDSFKLTQIKYS